MTLEIAISPLPPPGSKAKILPEWASDIRRRHATREATKRQLACEYGLTFHGVREIIRGRVWKGVI